MHNMHDRIGDINDVRMYHVREHEIGSFGRLDSKSYTNCREPLYVLCMFVMCCMFSVIRKKEIQMCIYRRCNSYAIEN